LSSDQYERKLGGSIPDPILLLFYIAIRPDVYLYAAPDRKNGINLIPSRYHWDQLDAKVIVLDINFPVRLTVDEYD
jgi:hypothetical protein